LDERLIQAFESTFKAQPITQAKGAKRGPKPKNKKVTKIKKNLALKKLLVENVIPSLV